MGRPAGKGTAAASFTVGTAPGSAAVRFKRGVDAPSAAAAACALAINAVMNSLWRWTAGARGWRLAFGCEGGRKEGGLWVSGVCAGCDNNVCCIKVESVLVCSCGRVCTCVYVCVRMLVCAALDVGRKRASDAACSGAHGALQLLCPKQLRARSSQTGRGICQKPPPRRKRRQRVVSCEEGRVINRLPRPSLHPQTRATHSS